MNIKGISESRFHMWRAVICMVHADTIVKPHEIHFILTSTKDLPFSEEQRAILQEDLKVPADMQSMFHKITSPQDKAEFFRLARSVSWADGDMDEREEAMLQQMSLLHLKDDDRRLMENFGKVRGRSASSNENTGLVGRIKDMLIGAP